MISFAPLPLIRSATIALGLLLAPAVQAQAEPSVEELQAYQKLIEGIDWTTSGSGSIGSMATLQVPEGYRFTGKAGSVKMMEAYGNLTSGNELAFITPNDFSWFALFEFDACGYVKDDEKDALDADKILKQMKEGQEAANDELRKRGMATLTLLGWHTPPFYNPETNNLEWAIRLSSSDGGEVINYKTKLLGRRGVMDVVLVCDEQTLTTVIPVYQEMLKGYAYNQGDSYASYRKGDKIAEYGLTGLIVGGTLLAAAKSGLLSKILKPLIIGVIAIGAFLKRLFVGKTSEQN